MNTQRQQELLRAIQEAVVNGDTEHTERLAKLSIQEGLDPLLVLEQGLGRGIKVVGDAFGAAEVFLPELIIAADALTVGTKILVEELKNRGIERKPAGRVVIGTAAGDIHDIGKAIVATMLSANGFEVLDLGVDVSTERFVVTAREQGADIVAVSALLTTTMLNQRAVIQAVRQAGLNCKVMVGGGPVNEAWANEIGADAYGMNAAEAVTKAKALMGLDP